MARILVIDDHMLARDFTRTILEAAGHTVDTAADGTQGAWRTRQARYDLVVVDPVALGEDGVEALLALDSGTARTPVIVVASGGAAGGALSRLSALALDGSRILSKPYEYLDFLRAVQEALEGDCVPA